MPRYIDAEKLRKESKMLYSIQSFSPVEGYIQDQIDNAPTEDVAPVKHAHWFFTEYDMAVTILYAQRSSPYIFAYNKCSC